MLCRARTWIEPFNRYGSTNAEGGIGRKCTDSNAINHTPRSPCSESCPTSTHLRCLPSPGLEGFLGQANKPLFTLPLPSQGPTHYGVIAHRNPLRNRATDHFGNPRCRSGRVPRRGGAVIVIILPVADPLPDIPGHIIDAIGALAIFKHPHWC